METGFLLRALGWVFLLKGEITTRWKLRERRCQQDGFHGDEIRNGAQTHIIARTSPKQLLSHAERSCAQKKHHLARLTSGELRYVPIRPRYERIRHLKKKTHGHPPVGYPGEPI